MATIEQIDVAVNAKTEKLDSQLNKSRSMFKAWGGAIKGAAATGVAALAAGGAILGTAAVAGVSALTKAGLENIDALAEQAAAVGTTVEKFSQLQHIATMTGSEAEALTGTIQKLNINLGSKDSGPFADSLDKIGLSAEQLKALDPADAFTTIAAGISELPSAADRASTAMQLLGKGGAAGLMNLLNAGPEAIEKLRAEADAIGVTVSTLDANKVGMFDDALNRGRASIKAVGNSLASELAPFLAKAVDAVVQFGIKGGGIKKLVGGAVEFVGKGIAYVADVIDLGVLAWDAYFYAVSKGVAFALTGLASMGRGLEKVSEFLGMDVDTSFLDNLAKAAHIQADKLGEELDEKFVGKSMGDRVTEFFDRIKREANLAAAAMDAPADAVNSLSDAFLEANEAASKLVEKLQEQIETFGMDSTAAEIFKLRQEGAADAVLDHAAALAAQLKDMEKAAEAQNKLREAAEQTQQDMKDRAAQLAEEFMSPLEVFEQQAAELGELLASGLISEDLFNKAMLKSQREFNEGQGEFQFAGSMDRGSLDARSTILRNQFGQTSNAPLDKIADNTKQAAQALQRVEAQLRDETRKIVAPPPVASIALVA